ncbi:ATP-grasp domain-containing protein [Kitasatospora sp. McL0602]|uniref:ATP-grasp domain-containing protein n=1 Tax=Kitasatospora sp. McL0602 TaxID=3439530 RepID=UPI003F8B50AF
MKDILLVGVGTMGRPYLDAALRLGLAVRYVEANPDDDRAPHYRIANGLEETWLDGVQRAILDRVPDGIVAFAEPHVLAGALAQQRLGLPGPSLHAATISRNKALQRNAFAAHGVPQPAYLQTDDLRAAEQWMLDHLPVVVKPLSLSGSTGVELVADRAAVDDVIARRAAEGRLMVEQAIFGPEFSWEALVRDGEVLFENVTEKATTPPPAFVELAHRPGHDFTDPAVAAGVAELTRGVVSAIGMGTGLVHLEFRVGPDGVPVLMEVAVRTPGDYIPEAISLTYGFDLYEAVLRLALGLPVDELVNTKPVSHAATFFPTTTPGTITAIDGVDEVLEHPAVVRVRLRKQVGDLVEPLLSSDQRMGHVLINAASPEEREAALDYVRQRLVITTQR